MKAHISGPAPKDTGMESPRDMAVKVVFDDVAKDVAVPKFTPA